MRILALVLLALPTVGLAQEVDGSDQNRKVKYAERTEIDFVGVEVTSDFARPQAILVPEVIREGFAPMIEPRTDFTAEMRESILQVR